MGYHSVLFIGSNGWSNFQRSTRLRAVPAWHCFGARRCEAGSAAGCADGQNQLRKILSSNFSKRASASCIKQPTHDFRILHAACALSAPMHCSAKRGEGAWRWLTVRWWPTFISKTLNFNFLRKTRTSNPPKFSSVTCTKRHTHEERVLHAAMPLSVSTHCNAVRDASAWRWQAVCT